MMTLNNEKKTVNQKLAPPSRRKYTSVLTKSKRTGNNRANSYRIYKRSMRAEVAKTTSLSVEVRKVGNDVSGLVQNVNTFGADIDLRANMLGATEHVQATKADMSSVEKSCHSIKGDTSMIKSSTETMKSRYLALSIEHQTILGQIKLSRQDIQELAPACMA